jgi:hypothetical protein
MIRWSLTAALDIIVNIVRGEGAFESAARSSASRARENQVSIVRTSMLIVSASKRPSSTRNCKMCLESCYLLARTSERANERLGPRRTSLS